MKKIATILFVSILSVTLLLSLFGCHYNDDTTTSDSSQNISTGADGTVNKNLGDEPMLLASDLRVVSQAQAPVLKSSFRDDKYYYYLFDLGIINNVPLEGFSNMIKYENHGQKTTHQIESSEVNTTTIANTVANTTQETVNTSVSDSVKIAAEIGEQNICKISAEYAYSSLYGFSSSKTFTTSYSNASAFSKEKKTSVSMTFDENAQNGYYGYILTGAVKIYAIVLYDFDESTYIVDFYSDIKQYWIDFYYFASSDEFVNYDYDSISFTIPSNLNVPTNYANLSSTYSPIATILDRYNCNDGNRYNKNEQEESADWRSRHNGFEFGELILYGCVRADDYYIIKSSNDLSIKFHILQNSEDLPRVGTQLTCLQDDTETNVIGTNINTKIGYGAYWVRITYSDDTQTQYNATNQFKNTNSNSYIELMNSTRIDQSKDIKRIEVVIVYELYAGAPGFMGIWWNEYTNWRCEYIYNFTR